MATFQKIIQTANATNTDAPIAGDIDQGELAVNLRDGKIYTKDFNNNIRTLNKIATSDSGTSDPGAVSLFISENGAGVGINIDGQSGIDLTVDGGSGSDGILKVTSKIDVPTIFRSVTNSSLQLSGGTDTGTNGANIELYGSTFATTSLQNNAYIDAEQFYVRDIADSNSKYISLGTTTPIINIGGANTTGTAQLSIGDKRTSDGNSQIIFRSKSGTSTSGVAKIIRYSNNDYKMLNHGSHTFIQADTTKLVKITTSATNTDGLSGGKVNLVAGDGCVRLGHLNTGSVIDSSYNLRVSKSTGASTLADGSVRAGTLQVTDDDAISFGLSGTNFITHNDGAGVFNIRAGHKVDQVETPDDEEYTVAGSGAAYIGAKNLGAISTGGQKIELKVSSDTTAAVGGSVTFGEALIIKKSDMTYGGNLGLGTTSPGANLHVVGTGGQDNIIFEANSNTTDGARITFRTSGGLSGTTKTSSLNNQKLGSIVTQGYQGASPAAASKIETFATNGWSNTNNRTSKMLIKLRGTNGSTNAENTVMKLYPTSGGKVAINSNAELTSESDATLHIGGAQDLGPTKDDFIEHLRLEADSVNADKLIFRSHRVATDGATHADSNWFSASYRIQRMTDSAFAGYIDFRSLFDSSSETGGTNELLIFGRGNDSSTYTGDDSEKKFFSILHDGRLAQYGLDIETRAHDLADDLNIGTSATNGDKGMTIHSKSNAKGNIFFADEISSTAGLISYDHTNNRMDFSVNSQGYPNSGAVFKGMQIVSSGNVGIQLTDSNPLQALHVNGQILATNDITAFSDERLKENIKTIPNALEKVAQLRGVQYTRKDTKEQGVGVIAQEIEKVLPEVVVTNNDEDGTKSVAYGNVVGLLIEAIKDLQKEVEELKRNGK
tara:strand:- start:486 stop:3155 length:2670 start_codon:yes stop_codon:yes gene_type:complete